MSASNDNFTPKDCPVGIANEKTIEHLGDRLDYMIEKLTEKVTDMKEDIANLSSNMDQKFDKVDQRFDAMDEKIEKLKESIPSTVNEELQHRKGESAAKIIGWIFSGFLASVVISVAAAWIKMKLGF